MWGSIMDFTTLIGIAIGIGLMLYGIGIDKLGNFYDLQSIIITVGGTFAVLFACFPVKSFLDIPKHMKILISGKKYNPEKYIDIIVEFAQIARKNGLLALEEKAMEEKEPFLKESILLIVDAVDADKAREMLEGDLNYLTDRHDASVALYEKGAALAPAFGMIGTLIGLINMLKSMDLEGGGGGGAAGLGQGMSVALITTLYGSFLANVIFIPLAKKLRIRHAQEILCKEIIIEGVLAIQSGENPKYIKEKLLSFLSQKQRNDAMKKAEKSEQQGQGAVEE